MDVWEQKQAEKRDVAQSSQKTIADLKTQQKAIADNIITTERPVTKQLLAEKIEEIEMTIAEASIVRQKEDISKTELKAISEGSVQ